MASTRGSFSALLLLAPLLSHAHHSTAFNYGEDRITVEGTVSSVKWLNPHASFVLSVVNEDGTTERWLVELLAKIALERQGFDFDAFEEGAQIQLTGRVGFREHTLRFGEAVLQDGRTIRERSPAAPRPNQ